MNKFIIKGKRIVLEEEIIAGALVIEDGKIVELITGEKLPDNLLVIDYGDKIIAPGYFDTHVHGFGGHDIMDCKPEAVQAISPGIVQNGVTSFLPTTLTDSTEKLSLACQVVKEAKDKCTGAKVQGIFLEGPFFTEAHKGAQNPDFMGEPSITKLLQWKEVSGNLVNKIAIAPEYEKAGEFIREARANNVYVALGHSDASYEQAMKAVENGANIFVHTYNGMSPLHHRNPGMVGAALTSDAYCEIICDGHHVHLGAIKLVTKTKGKDRTVLITDCMCAGGMPDGDYKLGSFDVIVSKGTARLHSGSLAGSVLKLNEAVQNLVKWDICTMQEAITMASLTPAKSVGLDKEIGSLKPGKWADINILNEDLSIHAVYVNGEEKYRAN